MKMAKEIILPMNEISDSVEMLHEKPNKGMPVFTWILLLLLAAALTWCYIGEIDYFVKANGIVRPGESVSTVSSLMTGRVETLNISEGDYVKKGDMLFKINTEDMEQSLAVLNKEKQRIETENTSLVKFEKSIKTSQNLFDESNPNEAAYYLKYEKYISDLSSLSEQYRNTSADTNKAANSAAISAAGINSQINKFKDDLYGLKILKNSVITGDNLFEDKYNVYALEFADYKTSLNSYDSELSAKNTEYEKAKTLFKAGGISKSDYDNIKQDLKNIKLEKEKFTREFRLNIEQRIENTEKSISELDYSLENQNKSVSAYSEISHDETLAKEQMRLEMLTNIADTIKSNENTIISIDKQIAEININIKNSEIISPIDGTINMYSDLNEQDILQSGQTVATIVPNTNGAYKLTMYLSSADISETEVGQNVRLRFAAYPYQEYGEFLGTVKSISTDVRSNEGGSNYYVAEVSIDDTMGLELVSGMECEARVVTKQRKILYWLLEKLDFIDD